MPKAEFAGALRAITPLGQDLDSRFYQATDDSNLWELNSERLAAADLDSKEIVWDVCSLNFCCINISGNWNIIFVQPVNGSAPHGENGLLGAAANVGSNEEVG